MKRLISLVFIIPLFSLSQPKIEIDLNNNDSIKKISVIPFFASHISLNQSENIFPTFLVYGTDIYAKFSNNLKLSTKIFKN